MLTAKSMLWYRKPHWATLRIAMESKATGNAACSLEPTVQPASLLCLKWFYDNKWSLSIWLVNLSWWEVSKMQTQTDSDLSPRDS